MRRVPTARTSLNPMVSTMFWAETLDEYSGVPQDLTAVPFDNRQALIDTWDLSWAGYHNSRVSG